MKDLRGKTAFITGGANGIGFAMARAFGHAGMNIALADIDQSAARNAVERLSNEQIRAVPIACDVTLRDDVRRAALDAIAAFGKVHVVCNNAGVAVGGAFGTVRERDWDWILDVNLKGVIYGMETFFPLMKGQGEGGHFVNTASMAGMISPPGLEPYAATKFAVVAMTEGWAAQLSEFGVGVSVLCPGFVRTRIHESGRARQSRYGGPGDVDPGVGSTRQEAAENVMHGIDPDVVGARVVEAVLAGELYIFTHPNMRAFVRARFATIDAAFEAADRSPALKAVKQWPQPRTSAPQTK